MKIEKKLSKDALIVLLSVCLILFTQWVKLWTNPESTPITMYTIYGLMFLWTFSMIGLLIGIGFSKTNLKVVKDFPVLGWVSITSLVFCLSFWPFSDFVLKSIGSVDFLSITTPILAFAGISVADKLSELKNLSWKVAFVAMFVFIGTYIGSATIAQIGLIIGG